ncbi:MAG: 2-C-methyl-D-erythritol 2,4-cyclodiphosphate synthase [Nevskiales bacterium]
MNLRIGHGYDAHRFGPGDHVMLGGVRIPCDAGVIAHSDGDVLIHALCDALLGAAALGDIGRHFPDSDPRYKDSDSRLLLREVVVKLRAAGYRALNADLTLVAEKPRVASYVKAMCTNLAADLGLPLDAVNVKATTNERLGWIGRGEGLAAYAVVLIHAIS